MSGTSASVSSVSASQWVTITGLWQTPVVNRPTPAAFWCYRSHDGLDLGTCQDMAEAILSRRELEIWSQLRTPFRRRRQWLLGRLCVKRAVQSAIRSIGEDHKTLDEINVLADEYGRPVAFAERDYGPNCYFPVSIAHSESIIVAIAGTCNAACGVGIDVEPVGRDVGLLEKAALRSSEREVLGHGIGHNTRSEWVVRLWCAKEALAKAIGRGMLGGPLCFIVEDLTAKSGKVTLHVEGKAVIRCPELTGRSFSVFTGREKEMVYATAILD